MKSIEQILKKYSKSSKSTYNNQKYYIFNQISQLNIEVYIVDCYLQLIKICLDYIDFWTIFILIIKRNSFLSDFSNLDLIVHIVML